MHERVNRLRVNTSPASSSECAMVRQRAAALYGNRRRLRQRRAPIPMGDDEGEATVKWREHFRIVALIANTLLVLFLHWYDVSPDGERFLFNVRTDDSAPEPITLVVNWRTLLEH